MFFFFNDTATTEIYTLSLHDALPISSTASWNSRALPRRTDLRKILLIGSGPIVIGQACEFDYSRSEEHTSELQSRLHLVCRLLLEKKKNTSDRVEQIVATGSAHVHVS